MRYKISSKMHLLQELKSELDSKGVETKIDRFSGKLMVDCKTNQCKFILDECILLVKGRNMESSFTWDNIVRKDKKLK